MRKSIFSPYATWKNFLKQPTTIRYPKEDLKTFGKPGPAPSYRGMHGNDLETCVGCGTCEEICPTSAITMVEGPNTGEGKKGVIPKIDYGRCCFCGFCVDVCTSSSLQMSRDYIYTQPAPLDKVGIEEVKFVKDAFIIKPGEEHLDNPGHITSDEDSWLDLEREEMGELPPEERISSFVEMIKGFSREQAKEEASRCVECEICVDTCPANMEIPKYIRAIWEGDVKKAVDIMYNTNPLPGICGRICTHKCETVCSISHRGEAVAIRWLKRYAVDQLDEEKYREIMKKEIVPKNKSVAVVGSGPAGLSAAYYLAVAGYKVTVFEALERAGGMMRVGVPKYRLPHEAIDRDIEHIISLGVEIRCNTRVGEDISLEELHTSFDAVFISTGLHLGRGLKFEAEKLPSVVQAITFLRDVALGKDVSVPEELIVIGGGNVAMDAARTAARLQKMRYGKVGVHLYSLESRDIIPCDEEEFIESQEEGVKVNPGWGPKEIFTEGETEGEKVRGMKFVRCIRVFNEEGRFAPEFDEEDSLHIDGDMVIEAIGQASDMGYIPEETMKDLTLTPRRQVEVGENGQTSIPWLFAGGDIVHGPDAIHGIADGHAAAKGIDAYLK
jgi:glutamate synthase (NADPH) small chain